MAGSSAVLEDGSLLSRLDKHLLKLETVFALLSGVAVFSLMFLAAYSVGGREFFEKPLPGYVDWIEALMPMIAFMGVAYVQRDGTHIRMDIIIGKLRGRALWAAELVSVLLILLLMIALVWGSWSHFDRSFTGEFNPSFVREFELPISCSSPLCSRDSSIDLGIPIWPSKLLVPIAFSVLCLRLLIQIWGYGRALIYNLPTPVAVPLIQSVEQQARAEAEQLTESRDG